MIAVRAFCAFCLAAAAACAGIAPGGRTDTPELDTFGCYASTAGWMNFGNPGVADSVVHSWLVLDLRRAREYPRLHVARFLGSITAGEHAKETPQLGVWSVDGDSIHVWWHNGFHGVELHVSPEGDALHGRAHNTTDVVERDSAGVFVPISYTREVRAARVPCEQIPSRLERETRSQEPVLGMPLIKSQ
jgi:hypothetical protein